MDLARASVALAVAMLLAACTEVGSAVDQANSVKDEASVCAEALGLADLNPLVDPDRLKARAADKERRLRELAASVSDRDVMTSLLTMADSYVEVHQERFDDLAVVTDWARRNTTNLDALRAACT